MRGRAFSSPHRCGTVLDLTELAHATLWDSLTIYHRRKFTMQPLFEIGNDLLTLNDLMDERDGDFADPEVVAALDTWLKELKDQEATKLDGYVALIKQLTMEAETMSDEAKGYARKAITRTRRVDHLKSRLKQHLEATGKQTTRTAKGYTVFVQKNGGKPPLTINDEMYSAAELPDHLVKVKREFDLEAIRKALEAGEELPVGFAEIGEPGTHLSIK